MKASIFQVPLASLARLQMDIFHSWMIVVVLLIILKFLSLHAQERVIIKLSLAWRHWEGSHLEMQKN
jgi:hypothetical protein